MKKNVETENKNEVMNNEQMSIETSQVTNKELEQFVKDNDNWVPKNQRKKFDAMTLNQKAAKIKFWQDMKKMRDEITEKHSVPNRVKELFEKRHATIEDAKAVLQYCTEFIDNFKQRQIEDIDEQIRQLELMKQSL